MKKTYDRRGVLCNRNGAVLGKCTPVKPFKQERHYWYVDEGGGWSVLEALNERSARSYLKENDITFYGIREATKDEVGEYASQRTIETAD